MSRISAGAADSVVAAKTRRKQALRGLMGTRVYYNPRHEPQIHKVHTDRIVCLYLGALCASVVVPPTAATSSSLYQVLHDVPQRAAQDRRSRHRPVFSHARRNKCRNLGE